MEDFRDIAVGDIVYVKKNVGRRYGKAKSFRVALKVHRTTDTLFYADNYRFQKHAVSSKDVSLTGKDQTKKYNKYRLAVKLTDELKGRVSAMDTGGVSNEKLQEILTILKG